MAADLTKWLKGSWIVFLVLFVIHIARYCFLLLAYDEIEASGITMVENYLEMVTEEWDQNLITGIFLTSDSTKCEQPAFERTWAGTSRYEYRSPEIRSTRGKG